MTHTFLFQTTLKILRFLFLFIPTFVCAAPKIIGITQIVDHPSLNAIREGILESLEEQGFKDGHTLKVIFQNAQGSPTTAAQIAKKFASLPLDVAIPITTPSAQALAQQIKKTPLVFAAVSDPLEAKIVTSLKHPEGNITGVADQPPVRQQVGFILESLPSLKTLGVIYNPGEANMVAFLRELQKIASEKNITLLSVAAPKSADVQAAAHSLIDRVDAFFIGNDNTVVSGLEPLVKVCLNCKKPLFMSDPDSVERGALAAYAYDQHQIGRQVGKMVAKVLKGKAPSDIPVETPQKLKVYVNPKTAELFHMTKKFSDLSKEK